MWACTNTEAGRTHLKASRQAVTKYKENGLLYCMVSLWMLSHIYTLTVGQTIFNRESWAMKALICLIILITIIIFNIYITQMCYVNLITCT